MLTNVSKNIHIWMIPLILFGKWRYLKMIFMIFLVLENKIISDLEKFYEKLNEREKVVFKNRLGYQDDILTLEEPNLFGVTREN